MTTREPSLLPATGALTWAPRIEVGRYVLLSPIAQGGMAEVWLARQSGPESFEKVVALKRILASTGTSPDFVRMFLDEARIAAQLSHPNIAQTFELAEDGGTYYLAMEYLEGETVSHLLRRSLELGRPLPVGLALRIAADAAAGLGHAHHQRSRSGEPLDIVHRDVSPQNIMVTYEGVVKVVDFGIARASRRETRTVMGVVKGKVQYMAPEQARGGAVDARADVFALGVVMFEMLTGTRLHTSDDARTLALLIDGGTLPAAGSRRADLAPAVDALVAKTMAYAAEQRFASGLELQAAIEECLRGVPPPSSSFDLRQYMHGLFADRIAQRRAMVATTAGASVTEIERPVVVESGVATAVARRGTAKPEPAAVARRPGLTRAGLVLAGLAVVLGMGLGVYAGVREAARPPVVVVKPQVVPEPVAVAAPPEPVPAEPEPVEEKKPVPVARGMLRLETDPYTQVFLKGRPLGDTPLVDEPLPAGEHTLRLVNAEEKIDQRIQVSIKPGQRTVKKLKLK